MPQRSASGSRRSSGAGCSPSSEKPQPPTFAISGTITGASGVTVSLTGSVTRSTVTAGDGSYAFGGGEGRVTLVYRFDELRRAVTLRQRESRESLGDERPPMA